MEAPRPSKDEFPAAVRAGIERGRKAVVTVEAADAPGGEGR